MITLKQARKLYEPHDCPNDKELKQILATFYGIANREWEEITNEETNANK